MSRYESCTYFYTLYDATENCFPTVSWKNACTILRETILAPDDYVVEFGNKSYGKTEIMKMLSKELSLSCVYETPQKTHYEILESAAAIIKHMNDGYVSMEDAQERNDFLEMLNRYEFTLFAAFCLAKVADSQNTDRIGELQLNIVRLREVRDLILNFTRDGSDMEIDRNEYETARPIYRMLKSLQSLGYEYNFSPKERSSLGIDHEDDNDLTDRFNAQNWLKRIMLLELRIELSEPSPTAEPPITETTENIGEDGENSAVSSTAVSTADEALNTRIAQLRGIYDKRRFDKNRFLMLEKNETSPNPNGEEDN